MAIASSGAISLGTAAGTNRSISGEHGGSAPHAISEYYGVASGVPGSGEIAFSDFHGTSAFSWGTPNSPTSSIWARLVVGFGNAVHAKCKVGFQYRSSGTGGKVRAAFLRSAAGGSGLYDGNNANESAVDLFPYTGSDPASVQIKMNWTADITNQTGGSTFEADDSAGNSWTKNTYRTIDTGTTDNYNDQFSTFNNGDFTWAQWGASTGTTNGITFLNINGTGSSTSGVSITARALDSSGNVIATSSTVTIPLTCRATKEDGFGGFCIHEDHLVQTEGGLMHIDDIRDELYKESLANYPKVYGYNTETNQKELTNVIQVYQVKHDNLYTINDTKVTEDHILYTEGYRPVSVNPTKAKEMYDRDSEEIKVGDKLMKFDGTLEEVTSISVLDGEHWTYTILTELGNFYANDILVDSEI